MMRGSLILSLSLSLVFGSAAVATNRCVDIFASSHVASINVEASIKSLAQFRLDLDLAQAQGQSLSPHKTALQTNYASKEKELLNYLTLHGLMTTAELRQKIKAEILILQKNPKNKNTQDEEAKKQSESIKRHIVLQDTKLNFHDIQPGSFRMGEGRDAVDVTLTKPFAMAATPTTQILWTTVLQLYLKTFNETSSAPLEPSYHTGDRHPVENVTYLNVQEWISNLNRLSEAGEPMLEALLPRHKKGDVYRLPTEAEWEFVATARGEITIEYPFGNNDKDFDMHIWHRDNSAKKTHPVGEKLPHVVDGKEFFDMHGHVYEWVADTYSRSIPGGIDPLSIYSNNLHVVRGQSFDHFTGQFAPKVRTSQYEPSNETGFRLVREVRP